VSSGFKALLAAIVLLLQGCIVIPLDHVQSDGFVEADATSALRAGEATRADVLLRLGEPDRRYLDDRVLGYRWTETLAVVGLLAPPGHGAGLSVSEYRVLLIEFDDAGRLRRAEVLHAMGEKRFEERIREWLAQVP